MPPEVADKVDQTERETFCLNVLFRLYNKICGSESIKWSVDQTSFAKRVWVAWFASCFKDFGIGRRTLSAFTQVIKFSKPVTADQPLDLSLRNCFLGSWLHEIDRTVTSHKPQQKEIQHQSLIQITNTMNADDSDNTNHFTNMVQCAHSMLTSSPTDITLQWKNIYRILQDYIEPRSRLNTLAALTRAHTQGAGYYKKNQLPLMSGRTFIIEKNSDSSTQVTVLLKQKDKDGKCNYPFGGMTQIKPTYWLKLDGEGKILKHAFGAEYCQEYSRFMSVDSRLHATPEDKERIKWPHKNAFSARQSADIQKLEAINRDTRQDTQEEVATGVERVWRGDATRPAHHFFSSQWCSDLLDFIRIKNNHRHLNLIINNLLTKLERIHKARWVVCDIKPENVLITTPANDDPSVYFSDVENAWKKDCSIYIPSKKRKSTPAHIPFEYWLAWYQYHDNARNYRESTWVNAQYKSFKSDSHLNNSENVRWPQLSDAHNIKPEDRMTEYCWDQACDVYALGITLLDLIKITGSTLEASPYQKLIQGMISLRSKRFTMQEATNEFNSITAAASRTMPRGHSPSRRGASSH